MKPYCYHCGNEINPETGFIASITASKATFSLDSKGNPCLDGWKENKSQVFHCKTCWKQVTR